MAFALAAATARGEGRVSIELEEAAEGRGAVGLRDLGRIEDGAPELRRTAESIEIARGSCSQPTTRLSRSQIEKRLFAAAAGLRGRIDWSGSEAVVVRWDCQTIASDRLAATAAGWLAGPAGAASVNWKFALLRLPRAVAVPSGEVSLGVDAEVPTTRKARLAVPVVVRVDGRERARVPVWFSATRTGDAPADVLRVSAHERAAVARSQRVTFRLIEGAVALESTGIALADGEVGASVLVRLSAGRKVLKGRVIAPGLVKNEE